MHELIELAAGAGAKRVGEDPFRPVVAESSSNYPAGTAAVYSTVDAIEAAIGSRRANAEIVGTASPRLSAATGELPAIHLA